MKPKPQPFVWIIITANGFYPQLPSPTSSPEKTAAKDPRIIRIETAEGEVIWPRTLH